MHIHYFQHDHFEDLGYIGNWAIKHNSTTSFTRFDVSPHLPQMEGFDWLVVLGGKMGVNDSSEYPWITEEIAFIRQAIEKGKTVIGICLGSQLVASALGAKVYKNKEPEMGFWPVTFLPTASIDPVFRNFPKEISAMHMHFDTFTLPEGAINMANSPVTQCQAFRKGNTVFCFQFHFEITPQNAAIFIKETEPELVPGRYTQTPDQMNALATCLAANNAIFEKVLDEILVLNNPIQL
jgi:GMP synthase-like glutamine amidotransferase